MPKQFVDYIFFGLDALAGNYLPEVAQNFRSDRDSGLNSGLK